MPWPAVARSAWPLAILLLAGCAGELAPTQSPPPASGTPPAAATRAPTTSPKPEVVLSPWPVARPLTSEGLRAAVDSHAVRPHLEALQAIADAHGGTRTTGSPGYEASVEYVADRLSVAGYRVARHAFEVGSGSSLNLTAELPGTDGSEVVMLGAHLDSGAASPGINDNGSGVATLLALAEALVAVDPPARTVRFGFWGAEEPGLVGSRAYVDGLAATERERIAAYLNLDIIGSPNYVRFVYDDAAAAPGSEFITGLFTDHFDATGQAWDTFDLSGKTDHAPFAAAGIPTGGLFSGGIEAKTDAQAAAFGGTAGAPADPCIDLACDTIASINDEVLEQMADAVAHVLVVLSAG